MKRRLLDPFMSQTEIVEVDQVGPTMRRITFEGPSLRGWVWTPGQQVRVQVAGLPGPLDLVAGLRRTYSIWSHTTEAVELCVVDHGDGPGARWARAAQPGDEVMMTKPQGDFVLRPSTHHLFVGDETASVAIGAMRRAVPDDEQAQIVLEIDEPANALPIPGHVQWLYRRDQSAASSASLLEAVRNLLLPAEPGTAYLAGEARTIQMIRQHLVTDRGWNRKDVRTKPFWTPGKTGME
jgi:NADPH-dependent ferric siderophore reductase